MQEEWRDIKEFTGMYQVSNLGRVRSLTTTIEMHWFKEGSKRTRIGRVLKTTKKDGKYHVITFYVNGFIQKYVHRLVASSFIGDIPLGMAINHIDGNIDNNQVSNLEIVNNRSNSIHAQYKRNKSSQYVGVYWNKARGCWVAMARKSKGQKVYLGGYVNEEDARDAYLNYVNSIAEIKYTIK
jgi:hypothetical protein